MGETEVKGLRRQKPSSGGNAARPGLASRLPQQLAAASLYSTASARALQTKLSSEQQGHLGKGRVGSMPCSASRAFLLLRQTAGHSALWRGWEEASKLSCCSDSPRSLSCFLLSSLRRGEPTFLAGGRSGHSKGRVDGRKVYPLPYASTESIAGVMRGMGDKPTSEYKQQVRGTPLYPSHTGGWPWHRSTSTACSMLCWSRGETGWFPPLYGWPCQCQRPGLTSPTCPHTPLLSQLAPSMPGSQA